VKVTIADLRSSAVDQNLLLAKNLTVFF